MPSKEEQFESWFSNGTISDESRREALTEKALEELELQFAKSGEGIFALKDIDFGASERIIGEQLVEHLNRYIEENLPDDMESYEEDVWYDESEDVPEEEDDYRAFNP